MIVRRPPPQRVTFAPGGSIPPHRFLLRRDFFQPAAYMKIEGSPQVLPEAKSLRLWQKIGSSMPKWIKPLLTCVYTLFNTHNPSHPNFQVLNTEDRLDARLITIGPQC